MSALADLMDQLRRLRRQRNVDADDNDDDNDANNDNVVNETTPASTTGTNEVPFMRAFVWLCGALVQRALRVYSACGGRGDGGLLCAEAPTFADGY